MSVRLEVVGRAAAPVTVVWDHLVDWEGQRRWIPLTTVHPDGPRRAGVGVHVTALSGFRLAGVPIGLLDRFVVTNWVPPTAEQTAELEVLHLGPYFTGPGVFRLARSAAGGTTISCVELFDLPAAALTEPLARMALPLMRVAFAQSLAKLAEVSERS